MSHRRLQKLAASDSGITTLEFAMISPVFLMMMMAIVEFSLIMFTTAVMESATSNTARLGKTGYIAPGTSRETQLIDNVANRTAGLLERNNLSVAMTTYSSFANVNDPEPYIDSNHNGQHDSSETYTDINGNGQWDADMGAAGAGNANDIVVYTVSYPWHIMTPVMSAILGATFTIRARTVVKNEPY